MYRMAGVSEETTGVSRPSPLTPPTPTPPAASSPPGRTVPAAGWPQAVVRFLRVYGLWLVKNVVGWLLILLAPVIGAALPGPGGLPLFFIGFAMITFPGKRHLTARVFRGIPLELRSRAVTLAMLVCTVLLPVAVVAVLHLRLEGGVGGRMGQGWERAGWIGVLLAGSAGAVLVAFWVANRLITHVPRLRRKVRPWMRRRGIDLLPPRRRKRLGQRHASPPADMTSPDHADQLHNADEADQEILEIDPSYGQAARGVWRRAKPWLRRGLYVVLMAVIFHYMLRPVRGHWDEVSQRIQSYNVWRFFLAAGMFAAFLFLFRALIWLKMLKGFGYRVPLAAGTRIWSTGELARYLPGTIWQVVGRVHLIKPYGVPPAVCSTTQILDIATFLLANIVVGLSCVLWFFGKAQPEMRPYLWGAIAFVPLLGLGLHPRVFYAIAGRVLSRLGKPAFATRLRGKKLLKYFGLFLLALLWQSLAIWILLGDALHIKLDHWWQLAGPYCLAWSAGFLLGWWSPGGLGVREIVFVGLLQLTLGPKSREMFPQPEALAGFLAFCSVLLRLWTITGELIVASIAYGLDYKGALSRPDAPGRVVPTPGAVGTKG